MSRASLVRRRRPQHARAGWVLATMVGLMLGLLQAPVYADPRTPTPTAAQVRQAQAAAAAAAGVLGAAETRRRAAVRSLGELSARLEVQVERWNAARAEAAGARVSAELSRRDASTARVAAAAAQADVDQLAAASYQVGADLSGGLGEWAAVIDGAFASDGIQGLVDRTAAVSQVTAGRRHDLASARDLAFVALQAEQAAARAASDLATREQTVAAAAATVRGEQSAQARDVALLVAVRDAASGTLRSARSRAASLGEARSAALALARARAKARAAAERRAHERERRSAGRLPPDDGTSKAWPDGASVTSAAQRRGALAFARAQLGDPYVAGQNGPDAYDCSGLTQAAYRAVGHAMIQYSVSQFAAGRKVPVAELQPGDLVFYATDTADWTTIHHVGIYEAGGIYVEAPHPGDVVKRLTIWTEGLMPYGARP